MFVNQHLIGYMVALVKGDGHGAMAGYLVNIESRAWVFWLAQAPGVWLKFGLGRSGCAVTAAAGGVG